MSRSPIQARRDPDLGPDGGIVVTHVDADATAGLIPVVICHGYGASADDLASLSMPWIERLGADASRLVFLFPDAPPLPGEMGAYGGRAWWPINMAALMEMSQSGSWEELHDHEPPGLEAAAASIAAVVRDAIDRFSPKDRRYVMGGFSQGAMATMDVTVRGDVPPPSLLFQFSGTMIARERWSASVGERLSNTRVLQSHGRGDPVLPFSGAEALKQILEPAARSLNWIPFPGPHTIPPEAVDAAAEMLAEVTADR